jgi:hypothetical protein
VVGDRRPPDAASDDYAACRARQLTQRRHGPPRARLRSARRCSSRPFG